MRLVVYRPIDEILNELPEPDLGPMLHKHIREYRNPERQRTSLAAWSLLERTLRENGLYDTENFGRNFVDFEPAGKPYFSGRSDLFISISHAGKLAAVAVSDEPIGMDLEMVRDNYTDSMIRRCLSDAEMARFEFRPEIRNEEFTRIWCKKEAITKLEGTGLVRVISGIDTLSEKISFEERRIYYDGVQYYLISACNKR